jgi:hypothetical protein
LDPIERQSVPNPSYRRAVVHQGPPFSRIESIGSLNPTMADPRHALPATTVFRQGLQKVTRERQTTVLTVSRACAMLIDVPGLRPFEYRSIVPVRSAERRRYDRGGKLTSTSWGSIE